jgi:hypothetical protein
MTMVNENTNAHNTVFGFNNYCSSFIFFANNNQGSVLHYSAYAFAVDPSIPTIIVPDDVTIGQREGFSEV